MLNLRQGAWAEPPPRFDEARAALLAARGRRVRPGLDDKRITSWNALMIAALAEAGAALGRDGLPRRRRRLRRLPARGHARRAGTPAAHLQPRARPPQRLPRGSRVPARGPRRAVRGALRPGPPGERHGTRRRDARALRRSRRRRLLHHLLRSRAADRPPQGGRGSPDSVRQLERGAWPAAACGADRRGALERGCRGCSAAARRPGRAPPAGARLRPLRARACR